MNIVAAGREAGEHLVTHPGVDKISFTGSTMAGKRIAALCGERVRRVTLELGGKSAAIVCDDADLESTVPALVPAGMMINGQASKEPNVAGRVRDLQVEPVNGQRVYAASASGGVWFSPDRGETWRPLDEWLVTSNRLMLPLKFR